MNYFNQYFNKEKIEEITYNDVVNFFNEEKTESDKIEFKSFVANEKEPIQRKEDAILKSICAFLNSEGGLLIWGAPVGKNVEGRKEKIFTGELALVEHQYEKDQFMAKIVNRINPTPFGTLFHKIENDGKFIYIFEIPKSEYAPHQFENRFFMRIDGQTNIAPYHYIEALFKRIKFPNLLSYLKIGDTKTVNGKIYLVFKTYFFNLSRFQNDYSLSFRIVSSGVFQDYLPLIPIENTKTKFGMNGHEKWRKDVVDIIHFGQPIFEPNCLIFDIAELQQNNWMVDIMILFGAKNSPMKLSSFKIRLQPNQDLEIIEAKENEFMFKEDAELSDLENIKKFIEAD
ncbi:MAG: hypothetical protein RL708_2115 [Bacteroidota bacterium]|jgi:hypothetical protein